ncbi:uncharacterized protein [Solanum lycopersicum]|uniref:uncharacterized protein isoform X4 n=1 Tax=Solanum lycopersicum TaxID=4081 RepID=UPI0037492A54
MYSKTNSALLLCRTWISNAKTLITCNVVEKTFLHRQHQRHWFCSLAQAGANSSQKMSDNRCNHVTRVLFCGPHFPDSHNYTREYLQGYPFVQVDDVPLESVPAVIGDYDICVVKSFRMNSDVLSRAKRMKLIMQFGVGLEGVDITAATKHGIKVAKIPGGATGNAASCAEMAIYLILGLLPSNENFRGAEKARGANWCQPARENAPSVENGGYADLVDERGNHADILKFASKADIVVCCLAMNNETIGIVNNDFISVMRKGAILINIARGGLLDYDAVLSHLKSGHLGGLGIDVAWTEPFDPDDAILRFPDVIITPHVAGVTELSYRDMAKVVGDVALQLHAGKPFTGIEIVN